MKNELPSKPAIEQTQPIKTASSPAGSTGTTARPIRPMQSAVFSACVSADSSFRF